MLKPKLKIKKKGSYVAFPVVGIHCCSFSRFTIVFVWSYFLSWARIKFGNLSERGGYICLGLKTFIPKVTTLNFLIFLKPNFKHKKSDHYIFDIVGGFPFITFFFVPFVFFHFLVSGPMFSGRGRK